MIIETLLNLLFTLFSFILGLIPDLPDYDYSWIFEYLNEIWLDGWSILAIFVDVEFFISLFAIMVILYEWDDIVTIFSYIKKFLHII